LTCALAGLCYEPWHDLSAEEFLRRLLSHILPAQFRRIGYYGFLVNSQRKEKLIACRALLGLVDRQRPYVADLEAFLERQGIDYSLCVRPAAKGRCAAFTPCCPLTIHPRASSRRPETKALRSVPNPGGMAMPQFEENAPTTPPAPSCNTAQDDCSIPQRLAGHPDGLLHCQPALLDSARRWGSNFHRNDREAGALRSALRPTRAFELTTGSLW
jgi:hypothetical protein